MLWRLEGIHVFTRLSTLLSDFCLSIRKQFLRKYFFHLVVITIINMCTLTFFQNILIGPLVKL